MEEQPGHFPLHRDVSLFLCIGDLREPYGLYRKTERVLSEAKKSPARKKDLLHSNRKMGVTPYI